MLIWEKIGHPRTLLERTGLSDSNIMLMACSYHILWQCTLSERPLWLLVLPVIKQFTASILGYRVSNGSLPVGWVGRETGVPKSAGRVACSVNLQPSQKFAALGWR